MLATILKNLGFGACVVSARDQFFEDNPLNLIITAVGAVCWMAGIYLERRRPDVTPCCDSTALIKQSLSHAGGACVANGVMNLIKRHDTVSANIGSLSAGFFMPVVIQELSIAEHSIIPRLKWEKLRFVFLVGMDYLSMAGMKKWMNGDSMDLFDIFSIPVGLLASIGEMVYSIKNDVGLRLPNAINRRGIKLTAALNFIFSLIDFVKKNNDKYTLSDDILVLISGSLMFVSLYQLRQMSIQSERLHQQHQQIMRQMEAVSVAMRR